MVFSASRPGTSFIVQSVVFVVKVEITFSSFTCCLPVAECTKSHGSVNTKIGHQRKLMKNDISKFDCADTSI